MEAEYELTPEDVIAFNRYHRKHQSGPRLRIDPITGLIVWILCCVFAIGLMCAIVSGIGLYMIPLLIAALFGFLFGAVGLSYYAQWTLSRSVRRVLQRGKDTAKILGWARVVLDAQGLHVTSDFSSCLYLWKGIDKVLITYEYIFIYVTTTLAQIVPAQAFADRSDFNAFADAARRYHAAAGVGEEERPRPTGIQTSEQTSKPATAEGIIPKGTAPQK
jgi:hypothetical protein